MSQTNYKNEMDKASAGLIADSGFDYCVSRTAETEILFGYAVKAGTDPVNEVAVISADTDTVAGVAVQILNQTAGKYEVSDVTTIIRRGAVWGVTDDGGVTVGGPVYVDTDGKFTDNGTGTVAVSAAAYVDYDDTLKLAKIEINLP